MKKQCLNCKYWIPLIDNGQCDKNIKLFCEFDDKCNEFKKKNANDKLKIWLSKL